MLRRLRPLVISAAAVVSVAGCNTDERVTTTAVERMPAEPNASFTRSQPAEAGATVLPDAGLSAAVDAGQVNNGQLDKGELDAGQSHQGSNDAAYLAPTCDANDADAGYATPTDSNQRANEDAGATEDAPAEPCGGNSDDTAGLERPTLVQYLSGHGSDDAVKWSFYCQSDVPTNRNCGNTAGPFTTINVPSNWEVQGFGTYFYGTDNNCTRGPNEIGRYRLNFTVPEAWRGRRVYITFEGAMTDTAVSINGQMAGAAHQGAFYCFKYNITSLLDFGGCNVLEATVSRESAEQSVNNAERCGDYWVFGGIFRPVYLEAYPQQHIDRIAADAQMTGDLALSVELRDIAADSAVTAKLFDAQGNPVGAEFSVAVSSGQTKAQLSTHISDIKPWSAEFPNLYRLVVSLTVGTQTLHQVAQNIGFRTVEIRAGDGIYINNQRVMFRGVNRHSFYPDTGRALNAQLSHDDVTLLKSMNVNAVRSSHYPPDRHFLDAADALGLYVLDELAGWHTGYATAVGTPLVQQMVALDVNHPSVVFWDNGNEAQRNFDFDDLIDQSDIQHRAVLHPNSAFNNVVTSHYPLYADVQANLASSSIFMPTEMLHGLYEGGGGAALDDYWSLMHGSAHSAGGFIWAFLDECVVRSDKYGKLDCSDNSAPDGVVGPHREPEGSVDTIREVWSPVQVSTQSFPYLFTVENRYDFTDLNQLTFHWQLVDFDFHSQNEGHQVVAEGTSTTASIAPGLAGMLALSVPADWEQHHALLLRALDGLHNTVGRWSWRVITPTTLRQELVATTGTDTVTLDQSQSNTITATVGSRVFNFDRGTGLLSGITHNGVVIALANGPQLTSGSNGTLSVGNGPLQTMSAVPDGNDVVITAAYAGDLQQIQWRVMSSGWLALTYQYTLTGSYDFFGVSFDFPEAEVKRAQWLGKGPYRVWKNRTRGTSYDVWTRDYNDGVPGISWFYPEFKGYFANVFWARLFTNTQGTLHLVFDTDATYLRLFTQRDGYLPMNSNMVFPPDMSAASGAGISLLQGIPAIGAKWHVPESLGPQSQPYSLAGEVHEATVYLFVGELNELPTL